MNFLIKNINDLNTAVLRIAPRGKNEDGKMLNYTQDEEEFVYFFETVRRVYNSEKKSRHIDVDNETEIYNTLKNTYGF